MLKLVIFRNLPEYNYILVCRDTIEYSGYVPKVLEENEYLYETWFIEMEKKYNKLKKQKKSTQKIYFGKPISFWFINLKIKEFKN